jgi:hypothetical protein
MQLNTVAMDAVIVASELVLRVLTTRCHTLTSYSVHSVSPGIRYTHDRKFVI